MNHRSISFLTLFVIGLMTLAACAPAAQPTSAPPTSAPAQTSAPAPTSAPAQTSAAPTSAPATSAPAATSAPTAGTVHVSIVNKDMTKDDIAKAIQAEGTVVVANWTYTANDTLVAQFQKYVKDTYGVDIKLTYEGSQAPSVYLTNLYTALKANNPSPYDVMAIEEPYYYDGKNNDAVETIYPSGLMPNWDMVDPLFRHDPESVGFQSTATTAPVYHANKVNFLKDWKDLADPRLKGRITIPASGDITAGGFLLGVAWSLGKDYKNPDDMKAAVDFVCNSIAPNALKVTSDSATMQQLLRAGQIDVAEFWNSLARLEFLSGEPGTQDTTFTPMASGQPMINGYLWIPKKAQHPILAQIFIDWRLRPDVQFPAESWGIGHGPWAELQEGSLGPKYDTSKLIPSWFADYNKFYPSFDQLKTTFKSVDWNYYAQHVNDWMTQYSKCAGG